MAAENGQPAPQPIDTSRVTPLNAPSATPDQAVTAGAATGPGPGPAALGLETGNTPGVHALKSYLPGLQVMASMPQASNGFKMWVRQLRAIV